MEPARSQLRTSALAAGYVRDAVLPKLDHHASLTWEDICQEHVLRSVPGVVAVCRWWGRVPSPRGGRTEEREVDVVGLDADRKPRVAGMCRWRSGQIDFDELQLLDRLVPYVDSYDEQVQRYLFSRSGFSRRLEDYAKTDPWLSLVVPADIYA